MHALSTRIAPSPLGPLHVFASDDALVAVLFEDHKHPLAPPAQPVARHPVLDRAARELAEYLSGSRRAFDVPLAPVGTPFQQRVWTALLEVAYGETTTYGALAEQLRAPTAARAVGAAVGRNPIAIIIPCHRVVGAQGQLTGYAGGLDRKRHLLALEGTASGQLTLDA